MKIIVVHFLHTKYFFTTKEANYSIQGLPHVLCTTYTSPPPPTHTQMRNTARLKLAVYFVLQVTVMILNHGVVHMTHPDHTTHPEVLEMMTTQASLIEMMPAHL